MLFRSCCAFSLKLLFVGDVVEQMDAEHLLFLPLHWPENLRAGKIQKFNWTTISCRKRRCLSWNGLMTEWSLMTNLLLIINRENPSLPLASHKITCCFQTFIFSTDVSPRSWLRHFNRVQTHTHTYFWQDLGWSRSHGIACLIRCEWFLNLSQNWHSTFLGWPRKSSNPVPCDSGGANKKRDCFSNLLVIETLEGWSKFWVSLKFLQLLLASARKNAATQCKEYLSFHIKASYLPRDNIILNQFLSKKI